MLRRLGSVSLLLLTMCLPAAAQRGNSVESVDLRVRLFSEDGHKKTETHLLVELLNGSYNYVAEAFCDNQGEAVFRNLPVGIYRLRVSGGDVEETTTPSFDLIPGEGQHYENVDLKSKPQPGTSSTPSGPGATVAMVDLNVPDRAKKEFDKGSEALQRNDLAEARKEFEKAIQIYPQYAGAYNNLGIVAIRSGDPKAARKNFEQAVQINNHYPRACINLAKLIFPEKNFPVLEDLLDRALSTDPLNVEAMTMLANVEYQTARYDQVTDTAAKVHNLPHQGFAVVHIFAGLAFQKEHRPKEAADEYAAFLKEAPKDPRGQLVRAELAKIQHQGP